MDKNKRQKRLSENINRLTNSLLNMGMPLWRVVEISKFICKQISEEEKSCQKQQD
ncbi:MAG: hypothetical protein GX957_05115 [Clostridiaceae bacterium]|nr:hypothetical protein [Clostridiaceae bacterium]